MVPEGNLMRFDGFQCGGWPYRNLEAVLICEIAGTRKSPTSVASDESASCGYDNDESPNRDAPKRGGVYVCRHVSISLPPIRQVKAYGITDTVPEWKSFIKARSTHREIGSTM